MPNPDVTVDSSTAETESAVEQSTEESSSPEVETSPAEAEKTETTTTKKVPDEERPDLSYARFVQINAQKKEATERAERLERELEAAKAAKAAETAKPSIELSEPPENLSQREKVDFYVRQSAGKMIQEELGMNLSEAKTLLQSIPGVSDATYEQQWKSMCEAKGLDPNDKLVVDLTRGLVQASGHEPKDALEVVSGLLNKKSEATSKTTPQRMENSATTATMTDQNVDLVWDHKSARGLAEAGKRVGDVDAVAILKAADKRRKAAG